MSTDLRELVVTVAFENGRTWPFRVTKREYENNSPEQLSSLLQARIEAAHRDSEATK